MSKKIYFPTILLILLSSLSCIVDTPPVQQGEYQVYSTQVSGLSGLCFSKDSTSLLAESDKYGIYELNFDGTTKRKLPYPGDNDFEAITMNHKTGEIYLADESSMTLFLLSKDEQYISPVTTISIENAVPNKGIEGLTYGNDTLYATNQYEPTILIKYSLASKKEVARIQVSFAEYLSDIYFDGTDNTLWICDSKQQMIFHCNLNGQIIASQSISFIVKAEALLIDRKHNVAWIGSDQTGDLYCVKLKI